MAQGQVFRSLQTRPHSQVQQTALYNLAGAAGKGALSSRARALAEF
jgi:hypothetical protein